MKELIDLLIKLGKLRNGTSTYLYFGSIGGPNLIKVRKDLREAQQTKEIDVILHSPGGNPADAYRLIRTFREKYEVVNVIVPFWAKSAATLFAFGANRLVLHEFGELGPIDAQIKKDDEKDREGGVLWAINVQSSLLQIEERSRQGMLEMFTKLRSRSGNEEIVKIGRRQLAEMLLDYSAKFYQPLLQKIETIEIGVMARYLDIGKMYAKRILKQYTDTPEEKINELLDFLVYECPDHGYVVDYEVLKSYLSYVIKADEEPFGADYYKVLEDLSISLMPMDVHMVGFLESFTTSEKSDIIKERNEDENETTAEKNGSSGGSSNRPDQKDGEENIPNGNDATPD